jgi:hypothetical protein
MATCWWSAAAEARCAVRMFLVTAAAAGPRRYGSERLRHDRLQRLTVQRSEFAHWAQGFWSAL